ncbi:competence protein ComK [Vagococcus lutrae]|uniref:competence protein ComK n=1 Tax=Vagococcus lutrae TaxID=81947 RepID=UPI002A8250B9|nr:competence protein ComK [Vagococcus lutrae]MDY3705370.1 competence protein ComK [Vagococcus lutrae]
MHEKYLDECLKQGVKVVEEYDLDGWYQLARPQADVVLTKETLFIMPYESRRVKGSLVFHREHSPVFVERTTWQLIHQMSQQQVDDYETQRHLFSLMSGKRIKKQPFLHHQHGIWLPLTGPSQYPSVWLNFDQFFSFLDLTGDESPYRLAIHFNGQYCCHLDTSYRGFHQRLIHVRDVCDVFSLFFDYFIKRTSLHHFVFCSPLSEEWRHYIAQHGGAKQPPVVCQWQEEAVAFF